MRPAKGLARFSSVADRLYLLVLVPALLLSCSDPPSSLDIPETEPALDLMASEAAPSEVGLTVAIQPEAASLLPGEAIQLSVRITNPGGNAVPAVGFRWEVSDPSVAEVGDQGLVTGLSPGSAEVSAHRGLVSASAQIEVLAPGFPVTLSWLNCMTGVMATTTSLSTEILGVAFAAAAPLLGIPAPELPSYGVGLIPAGSELDQSRTLEELGLVINGIMVYVFLTGD
jgi:hypothetical protein